MLLRIEPKSIAPLTGVPSLVVPLTTTLRASMSIISRLLLLFPLNPVISMKTVVPGDCDVPEQAAEDVATDAEQRAQRQSRALRVDGGRDDVAGVVGTTEAEGARGGAGKELYELSLLLLAVVTVIAAGVHKSALRIREQGWAN